MTSPPDSPHPVPPRLPPDASPVTESPPPAAPTSEAALEASAEAGPGRIDPAHRPGVTRLAPSPTGALHLGNARTFLINWALARQLGWKVLLRIEDLEGPRVKPEYITQTLEVLDWLGIDWDEGPLIQSDDPAPYRQAMHELSRQGMIYSCSLTRKEIEAAASAPHAGAQELRYPHHLRPAHPPDTDSSGVDRSAFGTLATNYRLRVPDVPVSIEDQVAGATNHHPFEEVGDFVLWTKAGVPSYQLAVVVDDARQGVTEVVRGADLLPSAARQQLIYRALKLPPPRWWHLPLVLGPDGRRLAKRHGDTRLSSYRELGVSAARIRALLAGFSGIAAGPGTPIDALSAEDFRESFRIATLPRGPITLTEENHRWLISD